MNLSTPLCCISTHTIPSCIYSPPPPLHTRALFGRGVHAFAQDVVRIIGAQQLVHVHSGPTLIRCSTVARGRTTHTHTRGFTDTHAHAWLHTHTRAYTDTRVYKDTRAYTHVPCLYRHKWLHTHTCFNTHTPTCTHTHTSATLLAYTHTHTHTPTHTHTHTPSHTHTPTPTHTPSHTPTHTFPPYSS